MAHPLDEGTERRELSVALPHDQWRVLDAMMQAMDSVDPGGAVHRYGHLLSSGFLQFRSLTRQYGSGMAAWRAFLENLSRTAESDETASGAVWRNPRRAWSRFWRIAWGMWWRYQIVNIPMTALLYYLPWPSSGEALVAIAGAILNVLVLGLAVSRAFNAYRHRYGSLPVLLGKPYG